MANKEIRKLTKTGRGSMYVVIPSEHLESLGWKAKQKLVVERKRGGVFIRDLRGK